jgi:hypothetical protein
MIITGLCRSIEPFIHSTISNMEKISELFEDSVIVIYENNSNDKTRDILLEWKSRNNKVHLILEDDNLDPIRTNRLARGRNKLVEYCETNGFMSIHPYLLMMDMDDIGSHPDIPIHNIPLCIKDMNNWDVLCGNTGYDVWALRSDTCPYDCWVMSDFFSKKFGPTVAEALFVNQHKRVYSEDMPCIEVTSGYGGISIFKTSILSGCRYSGMENGIPVCDTYTICMRIKEKGGKICIHPKLKHTQLSDFTPPNYSQVHHNQIFKKPRLINFLPRIENGIDVTYLYN